MSTETGISTFQIDNLAVAILGRRATYEELLFARAIEIAVLQSSEIQALRKDAQLYRQLKQACSVNTEFTAPMNEGDPERWCVMRRKSGVISSFTGEQLDFAVRHIPSTPARPESEQ